VGLGAHRVDGAACVKEEKRARSTTAVEVEVFIIFNQFYQGWTK